MCLRRSVTIVPVFDASSFNLDAYFERIGYDGPRSPDLGTLRAIARAHPLAIPFENLNPLLRRPVALDLVSLQQKLVGEGRGGYCFEHNLLLGTALTALGYDVAGLAARVMWNWPPGVVTPRGHMLLLIDLDGPSTSLDASPSTPLGASRYIVDAGFGGLTLTGPIKLEADVEQETPHEPCRLSRDGDMFVMEAKVRNEWKALYRFDLQRQALPDYEVTNWYLSNHPRSHFVTGLMAARVESDRRYALRNAELAVHYLDGRTERRVLASGAELRDALERLLRIRVPESPDANAAFERVISTVVTT